MGENLRVELRTRTPLWTGGAGGTMDRIHETGILGSLRWWYEAIVRGLGGTACDPASGSQKCQYNSRDRQSPEEQLCFACYVFGATGWRRRFSLKVVEDRTKPAWTSASALNIRPPSRRRGWYLPPSRMGKFTLEIQGEKSVLQQLAALLLFLEQWGHLGAKPQLGYGILQILNREEVRGWARGMSWNVGSNAPTPNENLPDLRRFGFFRYRFSPQGDWWTHVPGLNADGTKERVQQLLSHYNTVPVSPALKNEWRFQRWKGKRQDEQWMFGTTRWRRNRETVRVRSKIVVSWAYKLDREWEIRGWAWLQKPAIAADVWELLKDEAGWQSVLSLQGKLQGEPSGNWTERSAEQVRDLLHRVTS